MSKPIVFNSELSETVRTTLNNILTVSKEATDPKDWVLVLSSDRTGISLGMFNSYVTYGESIGVSLFGMASAGDNFYKRIYAYKPKAKKSRKPSAPVVATEDERNLCLFIAEEAEKNEHTVNDRLSNENILKARSIIKRVRDKHPDIEIDAIMSVAEWAANDDFWKTNIRSMTGLERNWDKIREASAGKRKIDSKAVESRQSVLDKAFKKWGNQ